MTAFPRPRLVRLPLFILLWLALPACLLLAPAPEARAADAWQLDMPHCSVNFAVRHILSQVTGHFDRFRGDVQFDPKDLEHSSILLVIDAASLNTGVEKRDDHLRSPDFLDTDEFPEITFQSRAIRYVSAQEYEVDGQLTMHGVTKNVTLPFTFLGIVNHPAEECLFVLGLESVFSVSMLQYGVGDGSFQAKGLMGEFVSLSVNLELLRTKAECRPAVSNP